MWHHLESLSDIQRVAGLGWRVQDGFTCTWRFGGWKAGPAGLPPSPRGVRASLPGASARRRLQTWGLRALRKQRARAALSAVRPGRGVASPWPRLPEAEWSAPLVGGLPEDLQPSLVLHLELEWQSGKTSGGSGI